ncbi:MAG: ribosome silencing factor [Deltaproteobacteria bacterium]|nr:ribosome silencing factor [Deltaproteobacteria bacterium]
MGLAVHTLTARKGLDVVVLDVKKLCSFADYFIIASGASKRQVMALADYVEEAVARAGAKPLGVEGIQEGVWVLMDYNDVVIHIFIESLRDFYNLEGLWADAPRITSESLEPLTSPTISSQEPLRPQKSDPDQVRHG